MGIGEGVSLLAILCFLNSFNHEFLYVKAHPSETRPLRDLAQAVGNRTWMATSWNRTTDPCTDSWPGVTCQGGYVYELKLESMSLYGIVPSNTLSALTQLRHISLKNNSLKGPLPDLINSAQTLLAIWFQYNKFSGSIPNSIATAHRLQILDLSNNQLSESIPYSLVNMQNLNYLHLEHNLFSNSIPPFNQTALTRFNVSFNYLTGEIPHTYKLQQGFPATVFDHNPGLCGTPTRIKCSTQVPPATTYSPPPPPPQPQSPPQPQLQPQQQQPPPYPYTPEADQSPPPPPPYGGDQQPGDSGIPSDIPSDAEAIPSGSADSSIGDMHSSCSTITGKSSALIGILFGGFLVI